MQLTYYTHLYNCAVAIYKYVSRTASFQKIRKNVHNSGEQVRHILSNREFDEESFGAIHSPIYHAGKFLQRSRPFVSGAPL